MNALTRPAMKHIIGDLHLTLSADRLSRFLVHNVEVVHHFPNEGGKKSEDSCKVSLSFPFLNCTSKNSSSTEHSCLYINKVTVTATCYLINCLLITLQNIIRQKNIQYKNLNLNFFKKGIIWQAPFPHTQGCRTLEPTRTMCTESK